MVEEHVHGSVSKVEVGGVGCITWHSLIGVINRLLLSVAFAGH